MDWIQAEEVPDLLAPTAWLQPRRHRHPGWLRRARHRGQDRRGRLRREHDIPCLGLCLGLHVMVIEVARRSSALKVPTRREFDPTTPHPVIDLMDDQVGVDDKGGTMRLGAYLAQLQPGSQVAAIYGSEIVSERHRHRYEVNPRYRDRLVEAGLGARARRPMVDWWSSSSCPGTRSGSPPRPIPSSRAGRTGPTRCSARWSGRRSTGRTNVLLGCTTSTMSPPERDARSTPGRADKSCGTLAGRSRRFSPDR